MTPEAIREWETHPLTQHLFNQITDEIKHTTEFLVEADMTHMPPDAELRVVYDSRGKVRTLKAVLAHKFFDTEEEEENEDD